MDIDGKDASEASDDSLSEPEEISNKDAKELAVASIKAELASQRALKEKAKKLKLKIELRNIEQKKIREAKRKSVDDSSPSKPEMNDINDKTVPPKVEKIKSEKPAKNMKSKNAKNAKKSKSLGNRNEKRDSSTCNHQTESKSDAIVKDGPRKLTGAARKKLRRRFDKPTSGKVIKNKLVKNSIIKTEKSIHRFKKFNNKTKNSKTNVVENNNSTETVHGRKRKVKEANVNIPKTKSMKTVTVKTEKTN